MFEAMVRVSGSRITSYLLAVLCTTAATLLTLVEYHFNPSLTYSMFLLGVMVSAWYGGLGPGLSSTALSVLAIQFAIEPSPIHFYFDDGVRLAVFALAAVAISELNAQRKQRQDYLSEFNEKLHSEVEKRTAQLAKANKDLKIENARRRRALKALHTTHNRKRALLSVLPDLMFRLRSDGTLLEFVTSSSQKLFAIDRAVVGRQIDSLLPPHLAKTLLEQTEKALRTRSLITSELALPIDGKENSYECRIIASGENEVLAIVRDVSDLKRKETALRRLTKRLTSAEEDERRRLSRVLHDEAGQAMTAINVGLHRAHRKLARADGDGSEIGSNLQELARIAESTQEKLRLIAHTLHPSVLEHLGLSAALKSFISELKANSSIDFLVDIPETFPRMPIKQETSLYRIAQEATTNAVRHSRGRRISIRGVSGDHHEEVCRNRCGLRRSCTQDGSSIVLMIDDDGCGFDWVGEDARGAFGLTSMRERAEMIGARLKITSEVGKGTSVLVCSGLSPNTE